MPTPGVHVETTHNPALYTQAQLDLVCRIAFALARGRFVLLEEPKGDQ